MSILTLRQHTSEPHFTLGDLEDLVTKARKTLSRDCPVQFPMDPTKWSDSHGLVDELRLSYDTEDRGEGDLGVPSLFVDFDFS